MEAMLLSTGVTRDKLEEIFEVDESEPMSLEERRAMVLRAGGQVHG